MIYNFGAALLRAVGDTRRPLYFLFAAGAVNVMLNLFFVIQLGMGVDGVAWLLLFLNVYQQVLSSAV